TSRLLVPDLEGTGHPGVPGTRSPPSVVALQLYSQYFKCFKYDVKVFGESGGPMREEYPPIMQKVPTAKARRSQRSDILDAAVDLFAKGGSRGTPMAAIAERIGVSIPAITHHFGSKHGLFMEVLAVSDSIDEMRTTPTEAESGIDR